MNSRAQSETIGVVLLVGIVVVAVSTVGAFVLSDIGSDRVHVDATIEVTTERITVAHAGGDPILYGDLLLVVRTNGTTNRTTLTRGDDENDVFEPGERWVRDDVNVSADELVTVSLYVRGSSGNALVAREEGYPDTQGHRVRPTPP